MFEKNVKNQRNKNEKPFAGDPKDTNVTIKTVFIVATF